MQSVGHGGQVGNKLISKGPVFWRECRFRFFELLFFPWVSAEIEITKMSAKGEFFTI
jgi:hypothetical protein